MTPRIGSFCTGYGGLDMAVQAVFGGTLSWWADVEPGPIAVMERHHPSVPNVHDLKTAAPLFALLPRVDILTAGYPCQPFSPAGLRLGTQDERHLWPYIAKAVGALRPGIVVLENVARHARVGFSEVTGDLAALGYDAVWTVVRASDVGAPHRRERLFVLAADATQQQQHGTGDAGPSGRTEHPDGGEPIADTDGAAGSGRLAGDSLDGNSRAPLRARSAQSGRWSSAAADTQYARLERPDESDHPATQIGRSHTDSLRRAARRDSTPVADALRERLARHPQLDGEPLTGQDGERGYGPDRRAGADFGPYQAAIERWERILGRPAPDPTTVGQRGARVLSPLFVEWMMGLPAGHVTDTEGLSRNQQLKLLGNGVVPQQAEYALRQLVATSAAVDALVAA